MQDEKVIRDGDGIGGTAGAQALEVISGPSIVSAATRVVAHDDYSALPERLFVMGVGAFVIGAMLLVIAGALS